jgi:molybdate transport system substrate-binding protein
MIPAVPFLLAIASAAPAEPLVVAAAADLQFVLPTLVDAFRKQHPEVDIDVVSGSSGTFFAQIQRGAPFDLFLSADVEYVDQLVRSGHAVADTRFVYGTGRVVLYARDAALLKDGRVDVVADPRVKKVAIANPRHAPYGRAAEAALKKLGLHDAVREKLVLGENVAQTTQFVDSGAADVGFVALSLVRSPKMQGRGAWLEVTGDLHPPIVQGGCVLSAAAHPASARAFRAFLLGDEARALLARAGFVVPPPATPLSPASATP